MPEKILIVEDNLTLRKSLVRLLTDELYETAEAEDGEEALAEIARVNPDLVIMDINLPRLNGLEAVRRLRQVSGVPVLILSVRGTEADRVIGLDTGADDYLAKPFGVNELLARIRALLRRRREYEPLRQKPNVLRLGGGELVIDLNTEQVVRLGQVVQLTPIESRLILALARQPGTTVGRRQLVKEVWGNDSSGTSQNLKLYMLYLRRKLEADPAHPRYLITVRGRGYMLAT